MMNFNETEKLLQQLPVAYYLKRKLDVKLDYADTSYIDIFSNKLVISYNQLMHLENPTEKDVRCLLYHEVSHAFLTPLKLYMSDIVNIFEDERIETICKNYYLDVNFKEFVKKINNYKGQPATSAESYFYHVVRYNVGEAQFVNEVRELIKQYAKLNRDSNTASCEEYKYAIESLYIEIKKWWDEEQLKNNTNESITTDVDENTDVDNENKDNDTSITIACNNSNSINDLDEFEKTLNESLQLGLDNLKQQFDAMNDENLQTIFKTMLFKKASSAKMNGSAINAYSGVFDTRSVIRQDYKYFVQQNRVGNVKRFSKIKLNLFIDTSGSFCESEDVVNKMLYNLIQLEKQTSDFEFDVVTMSENETLLEKTKRKIRCSGGNKLDSDIINLYNKLQNNNATNINVILFDGNAFSDYYSNSKKFEAYKNMKAFNHKNCIIISDYSNYNAIEKNCQLAKRIFVRSDYADLLIKNVVSNLQYGLR